jgi:hypothetical protein
MNIEKDDNILPSDLIEVDYILAEICNANEMPNRYKTATFMTFIKEFKQVEKHETDVIVAMTNYCTRHKDQENLMPVDEVMVMLTNIVA